MRIEIVRAKRPRRFMTLLICARVTAPGSQSLVKPLRNGIAALIQNEAKEIAAGGFNCSLGIENLVVARFAGIDHDHDTIDAAGEYGGIGRARERPAINQDIVEADLQRLDSVQTGIYLFTFFADTHQKRSARHLETFRPA